MRIGSVMLWLIDNDNDKRLLSCSFDTERTIRAGINENNSKRTGFDGGFYSTEAIALSEIIFNDQLFKVMNNAHGHK